ncbi:MAG TPA: fructose-6-phosphate aldolase [Candidatus Bilamarchaeum sp.]|nr:fructose-6-phosphate aldolase [Candidatus Bilamarchaeum sp.]
MKFFLDTANVEEIKKAAELGMCDGVTTNPTLIMKSGKGHKEAILEITKAVKGPVSVEGAGETYEELMAEATEFSKWAPNVVFKVPMTKDGLKAVRALSSKGVKTNVTLVFSASQALLVAKAGATYVSPFIGRLDDNSQDGMTLIRDIVQIYRNYGYKTEVLAASIRHPIHVVECAKAGADVVTMPADVLEKMWKHPLTDAGFATFREHHKKYK